jgi:hypothetical protein
MHFSYRLFTALSLGLLLSLSAASQAQEQKMPPVTETSKQFGNDTVHFSVLNTSFLTPKVARSYGIVRGKNKFLINVSVRRQSDSSNSAVPAKISGTQSDLIHRTPLDFREVIEQDAIYYIAEFAISNDERRDFRLQVSVDGKPSYDIQFIKMLYVDK